MTDRANEQTSGGQESSHQLRSSAHIVSAPDPRAKPSQRNEEPEAVQSRSAGTARALTKLSSTVLNRSRDILALLTWPVVIVSGVWGLIALLATPGPRLASFQPLVVGNTAMSACILKNSGTEIEDNIWVTLRAEPPEPYELQFNGAEGFANLRTDGGQQTSIAENQAIQAIGGTMRVEVERLAPGQAFTVTVKFPTSTLVSCNMTGSSGAVRTSRTRVLATDDYIILIVLFLIAALLFVGMIELARQVREDRRTRRQNETAITTNQGDR